MHIAISSMTKPRREVLAAIARGEVEMIRIDTKASRLAGERLPRIIKWRKMNKTVSGIARWLIEAGLADLGPLPSGWYIPRAVILTAKGQGWVEANGEPTPNAAPAAPKPVKLTATQVDTLRYFAGLTHAGHGRKPKEGTYAKLRNLKLIEKCDDFPYHRATETGHAWIANA